MADSPNIRYAALDPEYAALWAASPPPQFPMEVDAGRQMFKDFVLPLMTENLKPFLPDGKLFKALYYSCYAKSETFT